MHEQAFGDYLTDHSFLNLQKCGLENRLEIAAHVLEAIQQLKNYRNAVIPMRETSTHPYNQLANDGIRTVDYSLEEVYTTLSEHTLKFALIRNSIFHLRPKNVSHNMRLSGNKGQYFLYEGC